MDMSYLCVMSLWFCLIDGSRIYKKHVSNSVIPTTNQPTYNISSWVRQLHLQQCVLVEIGEKYCGIYVEFRELTLQLGTEVQEYFLGLCDTKTLRKWKFCTADLENERPNDCVFKEYTEASDNPSRVHRRLCDVTGLAFHAELCNCDTEVDGRKLFRVTGFPTCFISPLPDSLCTPRNVCGVAKCNTSTVNQQIHAVKCNPKCLGGQPFCELPGLQTTRAPKIESYWTDWSEDLYEDIPEANGFIHTEAMCINKNTGMGALDCLGPGTNCCPDSTEECKCYIYIEDGILKLFRKYKIRHRNPKGCTNDYKDLIRQREVSNRRYLTKLKLLRNNYNYRRKEREVYYEADDNDEDTGDEEVILEESKEDADMSVPPTGDKLFENPVNQLHNEISSTEQEYGRNMQFRKSNSSYIIIIVLVLTSML